MYVNGHHWNTRKLVFAVTRIREPVQCRTRTRVYVNAALGSVYTGIITSIVTVKTGKNVLVLYFLALTVAQYM